MRVYQDGFRRLLMGGSDCAKGNMVPCNMIVRDSSGAPTTIYTTYTNLTEYKTKGVDIEATYQFPLSKISGGMDSSISRSRALASYVPKVLINDGTNMVDRAGDVGDNLFDRDPPLTTYGSIHYDVIGRYMTVRAKVRF